LVRDFINQLSINPPVDYCVRVTAQDGKIGDKYLRLFQDNDRLTPTILTTSQKLSTGVDAANVRNIVLMRPVNNMIEFKQIIGRGTRLYEDKSYFTIIDFVGAHKNFLDDKWDGQAIEVENVDKTKPKRPPTPPPPPRPPGPPREKIKIKLAEGKEIEIQSMQTTFFIFDGKQVTAQAFIKKLFNTVSLPTFFQNEDELRKLWSSPITRQSLLKKLEDSGFSKADLKSIQSLIEAENSDLFDVLEYVVYSKKPIARETRVVNAEDKIYGSLSEKQREFIDFVLSRYVEGGVEELDMDRLSDLLTLKYKALYDGEKALGSIDSIKDMFINFQRHLY
jgi:type I restriction enzyme R subunit